MTPKTAIPDQEVSGCGAPMHVYFDQGSPQSIYEPGMDLKVDAVIEAHNIKLKEGESWWGVVSTLHQKGLTHEATLAQRFAFPVVDDATSVTNGQQSERPSGGILYVDGKGGLDVTSSIWELIAHMERQIEAPPALSAPAQN